MTYAQSSTATGRPPTPPCSGLTDRERLIVRQLCRAVSPSGIITTWDETLGHRPTALEIACLQNLYAAEIAAMRLIWSEGRLWTP